MPYSGVMTALVTPMREDGAVDYESLARLVEQQIAGGVNALVAVGTTGESPTLDQKEHIEVIRQTSAFARGRTPVIAGTGSNSTAEALELVRLADEAGADAHLQVAPYYNKPSPEGLYRHFAAVAEATPKPIILYSIPGRCVIEIPVEVVARLRRQYPHVAWIKESGGSCDRVTALLQATGGEVTVVSGDDSLTLPFIAAGAEGVISVASNLVPAAMSQMVRDARQGDLASARARHLELFPLFKALFAEPSPAPVKQALAEAGLIASPALRLPLVGVSDGLRAQLADLANHHPAL